MTAKLCCMNTADLLSIQIHMVDLKRLLVIKHGSIAQKERVVPIQKKNELKIIVHHAVKYHRNNGLGNNS